MKPEIKYFQNIVINLHLFTPVVRLAIFFMDSENLVFFHLFQKFKSQINWLNIKIEHGMCKNNLKIVEKGGKLDFL